MNDMRQQLVREKRIHDQCRPEQRMLLEENIG
jgi:hypothetical protein